MRRSSICMAFEHSFVLNLMDDLEVPFESLCRFEVDS